MFDLFAELSGLTAAVRDLNSTHVRIAEALERLSPPVQAYQSRVSDAATKSGAEEETYHIAESPEEYEVRQSHEAALAHSLGVAPWSPAFQRTIEEIRAELMLPRRVRDEEGNWHDRDALSEEEA